MRTRLFLSLIRHFDLVYVRIVIIGISDWQHTRKEMIRVAKPGGDGVQRGDQSSLAHL
jgi:ubiquinone/menaquinone biosynthesis C-methylase UbiE